MPLFTRCKISLLMSPEHICEVLAQYTPQINFYSLLKLAVLGCELKRAVFECVALNASELLLPEKRAELQELELSIISASLCK